MHLCINSFQTCPPVSEANKKAGFKVKCYKIEKGGTFRRGCIEEDNEKTFCTEEKTKDAKIDCFVCEKDYCNDNVTALVSKNVKNDSNGNDKGAAVRASFQSGGLLGAIITLRLIY